MPSSRRRGREGLSPLFLCPRAIRDRTRACLAGLGIQGATEEEKWGIRDRTAAGLADLSSLQLAAWCPAGSCGPIPSVHQCGSMLQMPNSLATTSLPRGAAAASSCQCRCGVGLPLAHLAYNPRVLLLAPQRLCCRLLTCSGAPVRQRGRLGCPSRRVPGCGAVAARGGAPGEPGAALLAQHPAHCGQRK